MGKKVFQADILSKQSIDALIAELTAYRDGLQEKVEKYVQELVKIGESTAKARIAESSLGKYVVLETEYTKEKMGCSAAMYLSGETWTNEGYAPFSVPLVVEFGAGIKHNAEANPKAADLGFGVGTFPGQTHAFNENGWYFLGNDGEWHHSYGVKATMPMYSACMEIVARYEEVARKVFV